MCFFLDSRKSSIFDKGLFMLPDMVVKEQGQSLKIWKDPRERESELEQESLEGGWDTLLVPE